MFFLKIYFVAFVTFFSIDLIYLNFIAKDFYKEQLGFLMLDTFRLGPALLFYVLYLIGLMVFVIMPGIEKEKGYLVLFYGGLFGLISYATYDLTNLATLKNWPLKLVIVDMLWGISISAITAFISYLVGVNWKKF